MQPWMVEMIQYSTQLVTNYEQVNTDRQTDRQTNSHTHKQTLLN